jgi:CSLREA domain-containing protein
MRFQWIALCGVAIATLRLEAAEAATFNVNSLIDENTPNNGKCTLREAIAAANRNTMSDDCQFQTGSSQSIDEIFVNSGTYVLKACAGSQTTDCGPLDIEDWLEMSSATRMSAAGKNDVTINAANVDYGINALRELRLHWITVANAKTAGVFVSSQASLQISDSNIVNNTDGIFVLGGRLDITRTNISNNHWGLRISTDQFVWLQDSTVNNNSEMGLKIFNGSNVRALMSTVSGNGVGVYNEGGDVGLSYVTVVNNGVNIRNVSGAGACPFGLSCGALTIGESIVSDPSTGPNCETDQNSFIDLTSRNLVDSDDVIGVTCNLRRNPAYSMVVTPTAKLGPLGFSGGPTRVHVPLPGSLAIDNGSPDVTGCSNDQRGVGNYERGQLGPCDLGSVEATLTSFFDPPVSIEASPMNAVDCGPASRDRAFTVTNLNTTPGIQCPGCVGDQYAPTDSPTSPAWADVLRLAFFGIHHDASETRDCDSDARRSLVANYTNIFEQICTGGACAGKPLRHLWRRSEAADATIADLLGTDVSKFCNAGNTIPNPTWAGFSDYLDDDPIRVHCTGTGGGVGDQVCGGVFPSGDKSHVGTLGLLLPIIPPNENDVTSAELYPTSVCTTGRVELLEASKTTFAGYCPAGNPSFGGRCFTSVIDMPGGGFSANCIQVSGTATCPYLTPVGTDCRGASLWMRRPNGTIVIAHSPSANTVRRVTGAFFRIHSFRSMVAGAAPCAERSADSQVACLVDIGDVCTAGVAATPN